MRAFKCDRCGALYEDYLNRKSAEIYHITTTPNMTGGCLDLCKTCSDKLQKWVDMAYDLAYEKAESEE